MKKKSIITILALVGIAVIFFFILQNNKEQNQQEVELVAQENEKVAVKTTIAQNENISGMFSVNGTFLPKTKALISSELGGQIVAIYVKEGDTVQQGQVVAKLAGDKLNVSVENAKANLDNALSTLQRYEAAYKTGGVTEMQLDQVRLQVQNARAQYQSAQLNSGDTNVRAKTGGIVNQKLAEVGTVVGPGTPILEVVDISDLKLKVEVDEAVVSQLGLGREVEVVPSVTDDTIVGRITFIAPASNGALKFPVEVTVDNEEGYLRAGMYATAYFDASNEKNALILPREAFVGSVSEGKVFIVKDSTARLSQIRTGKNYGDKIEVIDGLNVGDVVVVSGQINLQDSTAVSIID